MSYADRVFIHMCRDIIDNGTDTEGREGTPGLGGRDAGLYDQEVRGGEPL